MQIAVAIALCVRIFGDPEVAPVEKIVPELASVTCPVPVCITLSCVPTEKVEVGMVKVVAELEVICTSLVASAATAV